jgi:hypothetical protein
VIRDLRGSFSPYARHWECVEELQQATDAHVARLVVRRLSPATALARAFRYSRLAHRRRRRHGRLRAAPVPFAWVGRRVEIRGAAGRVQILADQRVIAVHPRHTPERIVIDPGHYDGPSTDTIGAPMPLGRMGRKLAAIQALPPERRPLNLYAALAEVAR